MSLFPTRSRLACKLISASLGVVVPSCVVILASCGGSTDSKPAGNGQDAADEHPVGNLPSLPADAQPDQQPQADTRQPPSDAQQQDESPLDGASESGSLGASDGSAPPRAFVLATLGAARDANNNNLCNVNFPRTVLSIGTELASPTTVADGDLQMGSAVVHVTCSVKGGFDVLLLANLGGLLGGSLTIVGHVDVSSGGQGIHAVLNVPNTGGSFSQDTCTIAFTYAGGPVPASPAVAPGRIWAHLSCPAMRDTTGANFVHLMDGTTVPEMCDGELDFVFENCTAG